MAKAVSSNALQNLGGVVLWNFSHFWVDTRSMHEYYLTHRQCTKMSRIWAHNTAWVLDRYALPTCRCTVCVWYFQSTQRLYLPFCMIKTAYACEGTLYLLYSITWHTVPTIYMYPILCIRTYYMYIYYHLNSMYETCICTLVMFSSDSEVCARHAREWC